ncbi:MAG: PAS domain S-box protein [Microcoleaceae cyanobacterium]
MGVEERIQQLQAEVQERQQTEFALRQSQAQLAAAQRISHVGSWEFDLASQTMTWSEELYRILGCDPAEQAPSYAAWRQRVHPEDWPALETAIAETIAQGTPYEVEHRVVHPDGSLRYVLSRGEAIEYRGRPVWRWSKDQGGYGEAEQLNTHRQGHRISCIGTVTDITKQKQSEQILQSLLEGTATVTGADFFPVLAQQISLALEVPHVFISSLEADQFQTLGVMVNRQLSADIRFPAQHTPCQEVTKKGWLYCENLQTQFPHASSLACLDANSYLGVAMKNTAGKAIGLVCILNDRPIQNPERSKAILKIFAARASAEVERLQAQEALQQLNQELEHQVAERTRDLLQSKNQLQDQEQFLRSIFDNIEHPIFVIDVLEDGDFRISGWNPASERICNIAAVDVMGKSPIEAMGVDAGNAVSDNYRRCIDQGSPLTYEEFLSFPFPIGNIWTLTTLNPLKDSDGRICQIIGTALNITDRKQTEAQLQEREQFLSSIYDGVEYPIFVIDVTDDGDFRYIGWNQTAEQASGKTSKEITGKTPEEIYGQVQGASERQRLMQCLETELYMSYEECLTFDDQLTWWITTINPLKDSFGKIYRFVGTAFDITERKQSEAELLKLEALIQNSQDFIGLASLEGKPLYINQGGLKLLGLQNHRAITSIMECFLPQDVPYMMDTVLPTVMQEGLWRGEYRFRNFQTGEAIPVDYNLFVLKDQETDEPLCLATVTRDISQQRQAQQALRESEQRFRTLFEDMPMIAVQGYDMQRRVIFWNQASERLYGYTATEAMGRTLEDLIIPPDLRESVISWVDIWIQGGPAIPPGELNLLHKDGSSVNVYSSHVVLQNLNNELEMYCVDIDLRERKQAEHAIRESEERFRQLAGNIDEIFWMLDVTTRQILYVSPGYEKIWRRSCQSLYQDSQSWLEPIHPDDREQLILGLSRRLRPGYEVEYRLLHPNGDMRWVRDRAFPICNEQGQVYRIAGVAEDITERKRLAEEQDRLVTIFEASSDFVGITEPSGRVVWVNRHGKLLSGLHPSTDVTSLQISDFHPDWAAAILINQGLPTAIEKGLWIGETAISDASGAEIPVSQLIIAHKNSYDQVEYFSTIARDIRDLKQAEADLRRANTDLEQRVLERTAELQVAKEEAETANRAKSEFLANMSHELRTPLNGILGYAQILQHSPLSSEDKMGVDVIRQCGSHLLTLINDILDLSKIEAQCLELCPREFHFPDFLRGVADICRVKADQKRIRFDYDFDSSLPMGVQADDKRLRQVLLNLLSNAIKFTREGSVTFIVQLQARDIKHSTYRLRFAVQDTGVGLEPDQIEKIFLPFEQVGDLSNRSEGTGLGLTITQKILGLMGTELDVESTFGQGSTFSFEVDLLVLTGDQRLLASNSKTRIGYTGERHSILVVDDRSENRSFLLHLLQSLGFEVVEAENGQTGLEQAKATKIDLIITDILMPIMDGWEMTRQLRDPSSSWVKTHPELQSIPVIAASVSVSEAEYQESYAAGCNEFLPKPINTELLLLLLEQYLQLEWIYSEAGSEEISSSADESTLIPPSYEDLQLLDDLVKKGRITLIISHAENLAELDSQFAPFAQKIIQFAREFELDNLQKLIEEYLH